MTAGHGYRASEKIAAPAPVPRIVRYLRCIRYREVLILQGFPMLGAALAMREVTTGNVVRLAILAVASFLLLGHVFALNDLTGMGDLTSPGDAPNAIAANEIGRVEIAWLSIAFLVPSLLLFSAIGLPSLLIALAIAVLSLAYSLPAFHAKGIPIVSSAIHLCGGLLYFLLGYLLFSSIDGRAIAIAFFFALPFVAGHLSQEVRDYEGDLLNGIRTNAVVFGKKWAFIMSLVLFTLAYVLITLLALRGVLPRATAVVVVLYPFHLYWSLQTIGKGLTSGSIRRLQARYQALFAIIGIWVVAALRFERW